MPRIEVPEVADGAYVIEFRPPPGVPNFNVAWGLGPAMRAVDTGSTAVLLSEGAGWRHAVHEAQGRPLVVVVRTRTASGGSSTRSSKSPANRPDLTVVEMGWPGPDRLPGRTCIATYGVARVSAEVVAESSLGASV